MSTTQLPSEELLSPLGKPTEYAATYTPSLLYSIERTQSREAMGVSEPVPGPLPSSLPSSLPFSLPFGGEDVWNAYELSWLNESGKPQVSVVRIHVSCNSPCIVESKSLKLYLNSFSQTRFTSPTEVLSTLNSDLGVAFRAPVMVEMMGLQQIPDIVHQPPGICIDDLEVAVSNYQRTPHLLQLEEGQERVLKESLYSNLFRSLCPVTGQPDFATIIIQYMGRPIVRASLLKYLISFRCHEAFHEATIEQIFLDITDHCRCEQLSVSGRFLRRGGIDINPFRSSIDEQAPELRLPRQ